MGWCFKLKLFIREYWFQIFWTLLNIGIFYKNFKTLNNGPEHFYLRKILGVGLCISRGIAPVLNLSCCLVLLPMCRSINTLTHTTLSLVSKKILIVYLSKIKSFHITFATTILIASVIHTLGHIVNAFNFSKYYNELYEDINWAEYKNQNPMVLVFKTIPGFTGVLMCIILILLTMTSLRCFRQFHYNVFWYTHNLSIIFLLLLFLHPLSGVIKQQINLTEHIPGCLPHGTIFINTSTTVVLCKEQPKFQNVKSKGWIWIIIPVIIYWMELCFRFYNRHKYDPKILRMYRLPGQTIYLTLLFRGNYSNFRPGQFILLKCDQLSKLEWHPFSIISCEHSSQNNNYNKSQSSIIISILIRSNGDWTSNLYKLIKQPLIIQTNISTLSKLNNHNLNMNKNIINELENIKFHLDGPYTSCMTKLIHSQYVICIAGGIGITAFIGSLKYLLECPSSVIVTKRIHLIWIVKNGDELTWFAQIICDLYHKFWFYDEMDRFHVELYITNKKSLNNFNFCDNFQILQHRIQYGRPKFQHLFNFWKQLYEQKTVNLFCCGPKMLLKDIKKLCIRINLSEKIKFNYLHDSYS